MRLRMCHYAMTCPHGRRIRGLGQDGHEKGLLFGEPVFGEILATRLAVPHGEWTKRFQFSQIADDQFPNYAWPLEPEPLGARAWGSLDRS
jgi:hypothetical protein